MTVSNGGVVSQRTDGRSDKTERGDIPMPTRFADLKRQLVPPEDTVAIDRVTCAWNDVLRRLKTAVEEFEKKGPEIIPQIHFKDLNTTSASVIEEIKRRGCVLIRNVVEKDQAVEWKEELARYVKVNPVEGIPDDDKQFFMLYWARPQVQARAHPNVLETTSWLSKLYHIKENDLDSKSKEALQDVDLSVPLTYADRFRIRRPGIQWDAHPPHIDGGAIERWEDPQFRSCFANILAGHWEDHDPYDLAGRLLAKTSLYGRPNQASVFRTFQGWLALSETAPTQGTLKVFPDVRLSNAYVILRPFFKYTGNVGQDDPLEEKNWTFDVSSPEFPGIFATPTSFRGPRLSHSSHPHLQLEKSMTSVPTVEPGDMVFWHCDVIHSVEKEHTGKGDSSVMYIPAIPSTPQNISYIARQKESFLQGIPPPDFPRGPGEAGNDGFGKESDIVSLEGRRAMGLA